MKPVYCISGLGADSRIFSRLEVPGARFIHLEWLTPFPDEPIEKYAARMMEQVDPEQPVLLGVSFGGMMAIEMAKLCSSPKVILVSSVKSRKELPNWMKLCGRLRLDNLVPSRPWKGFHPMENYFLGTESLEEVGIANDFRGKIDPGYLHWAIRQVLTWRNEWQPEQLWHIHGEKDRMFPLHRISSPQVIPKGGHFMVMNRAGAVSDIISRIC